VFQELVGETAALSANTIVRLKAKWGEDYEVWRTRSLEGHTYAYIWADVLRGLRDRGLSALLVAVGDGALGLWETLDQVFPQTDHQRYRNHLEPPGSQRSGQGVQAAASTGSWAHTGDIQCPDLEECEELRDLYVAELRANDHQDAAETMLRDWGAFVTFYRYPKRAWAHLRTSNPLESIFSGVRIRIDATRRVERRESGAPGEWSAGRVRYSWCSRSSSA